MKVLVIGATGALGRPSVSGLVAAGHQVTGLARGPEKAALLRSLGATPVQFSLDDDAGLRQVVEGQDVVIHMATHIPRMTRMRPGAFNETDQLRRQFTPRLVDAALTTGVPALVKESITFNYVDRGAEWIDEAAPVDPGPYTASALDAEAEVARFTEAGGRGVVLRFGAFYGPEARSTIDTVKMARRRIAAQAGRPDAYLSSIHTDDAAAAVEASLRAPAGLYNVVDDEPLSRRAYFQALASAFGLKVPKLPPAAVTKLAGKGIDTMARSQRVSNQAYRSATGWTPAYPSAREGWSAIAAAWHGALPAEA